MIDEGEEKQDTSNKKNNYKKVENYLFSFDWKLGSGSFSEVFKAINTRNSEPVAIKIIKLESVTSKVALTLLQQEIGILKELQHPNVIKFHDVMNSSNNCYIVTEFCKYGDLEKLLRMKRKFEESEIAAIVYHIFKGLEYLSEQNIIHRDFKIANIFMDEASVCKIADFGFAIKSNQQFKDISLGSPIYMTPETIINNEYGPKTDVWAFGALIYELICGRAPLTGVKTQEELKEKIVLPPPPINEPISTELRNFIDRCLTVSVKNRISIKEMKNHSYIKKIIAQNESKTSSISDSISMDETKYSLNHSKLEQKLMNQPLVYEEGYSILQYCRLLSKTCQIIKSQIWEQWLLKIIEELCKTKLKENQVIDYEKYTKTINNYQIRYNKEFKDKSLQITIHDVIRECEELLARDSKYQKEIIAIGKETSLLKESLTHPLKLIHYVRNTNASAYMA